MVRQVTLHESRVDLNQWRCGPSTGQPLQVVARHAACREIRKSVKGRQLVTRICVCVCHCVEVISRGSKEDGKEISSCSYMYPQSKRRHGQQIAVARDRDYGGTGFTSAANTNLRSRQCVRGSGQELLPRMYKDLGKLPLSHASHALA